MKKRKVQIMQLLENKNEALSASEIAQLLGLDRANTSRYLKELAQAGLIKRNTGRPVRYQWKSEDTLPWDQAKQVSFEQLVGNDASLKVAIQQAKAAILYPPRGLHTLILGATGTGKSLFAECMYQFARQSGVLQESAPFITFNCADYAQNPQLLYSHIFGVKKGAYTGANQDRMGLVAKADHGILFLDEIHRLPPEGQEMLFTFIDKGCYRPLGESQQLSYADVQIIGATTAAAESFLTTFNRRIPLTIQLPSLTERSLEERYEMIMLFLKQEAIRLEQAIFIERTAFLAFLLYEAVGNIGQIKRDIKLVCAKAFFTAQTQQQTYLKITQEDLPLAVQKGLLSLKEHTQQVDALVPVEQQYLSIEPMKRMIKWTKQLHQYAAPLVTKKAEIKEQEKTKFNFVNDAGHQAAVEDYFHSYLKELDYQPQRYDLIDQKIWQLVQELYQCASERLNRTYEEKAHFIFALHLQNALQRIQAKQAIHHPDLNYIRKNYPKEFQVAIELASLVEEKLAIEIPFDEIGFITMFLAVEIGKKVLPMTEQVAIIVMMHGKSTASSMLEAVQELLNTQIGTAINLPLTMSVQAAYEQLKDYVLQERSSLKSGILLLTDMGSLTTFSHILIEETGVLVKCVSMVSTMVVLEAVRMASIGRSLSSIYQSCQLLFQNLALSQFHDSIVRPKAVVVACFTGEGVAKQLKATVSTLLQSAEIEIISLQFLEPQRFLKKINTLAQEYEIKAIVGTVEIAVQDIPFFQAMDILNGSQTSALKQLVLTDFPLEMLTQTLKEIMQCVPSIEELVAQLQHFIERVQVRLDLQIAQSVKMGLFLHLAFLIDSLLQNKKARNFPNLIEFQQENQKEMQIIHEALQPLALQYNITFSDSEIAYLAQMVIANYYETV